MRIAPVALACVLSISLAQCGYFADPNSWPQKFEFGDSATLASGAGIRLVSERERLMPNGPPLPTVCTEPSSDVAIAFGRSLSAQASITEQGGTSGSGQFAASSTEEATALAGRTAGVLALRDGLYAACQAYTNGVLGQDAYAMVLSQYGNLLVALAGSNTGTGAEQAYTPYGPQDVAIATLLVSCITEYDPTRLAAIGVNGRFVPNPMLSKPFCQKLLTTIASGKPVTAKVTKAAAASPKAPPPAKTAASTPLGTASQSVTIKVTGPSSGGDSGAVALGKGSADTPASPPPASTPPAAQPKQ